jgi:predicted dehydrogenase
MRKINWGVIGTAGIAKGCTIPGMQQAENCYLYAIAGRTMEKAVAYQKEFGFEVAYDSYEALLADPKVEAVYIPLPNELHYEWTIKALNAKKHVLCEKPLAPTPAQIQEMFACAKENGVILMEAFAYLHSPLMAAIKKELQSGIIGDVLYMESQFITSDYDISNIRMRKETYGGATYDLGCYTTTQILWMLDEEPVKVQAVADFSDRGIDTYTSGLLTFADGKKATYICAMVLATDKDRRIDCLRIHGTKGDIRTDAQFNQCGELSYTLTVGEEKTVKTVSTPQNYSLEVTQLGRCITDGEKPHISQDFSMKNALLMEKILKIIGY